MTLKATKKSHGRRDGRGGRGEKEEGEEEEEKGDRGGIREGEKQMKRQQPLSAFCCFSGRALEIEGFPW